MNPLYSKKNFGDTGISVSFHNGTAVKTGYITRQSGTNTFICTDDTKTNNTLNTWKVRLAQTAAKAGTLTAGFCTIPITAPGGSEHIRRIWNSRLLTVEGHTYKWSLDTSKNGSVAVPLFGGGTMMMAKAEAKEVKQAKVEAKAEEAKAEAKPQAKVEAKAEAKPEAKPQAKVEAKAEEAKAEAKTEAKAKDAKDDTSSSKPNMLHIKGEVEGDIRLVE